MRRDLAQLTRLAVPALGDWCGIDIHDEGGTIRRFAVVHSDPEKEALA